MKYSFDFEISEKEIGAITNMATAILGSLLDTFKVVNEAKLNDEYRRRLWKKDDEKSS